MKYTYYLYLVISSYCILNSWMLDFFPRKKSFPPKTLHVLELPTSINHPQTRERAGWQAGQVQGIPLMVDLVAIPGMDWNVLRGWSDVPDDWAGDWESV